MKRFIAGNGILLIAILGGWFLWLQGTPAGSVVGEGDSQVVAASSAAAPVGEEVPDNSEQQELVADQGATSVNENQDEAVEVVVPPSAQLDVPFTSQAPHANWNLPYQEACEEASVLMAARFIQGRTISDAADADQALLALVARTAELGYPIDTTAVETAHMLESFYEIPTIVIIDFTWDDVKQALAAGYPVIIPAAGQQLGNPNFTTPGPRYHMLIITGYDENGLITNDPGTRNGAGYHYSYETLFAAAHDWNGGAVESGQKVIIVVGQ